MKRFVPRWSDTSARATAVVASGGEQHHAAHVAANHCLRNRRLRTSRATPLVVRQGGIGREAGASSTASSSRTRWLKITFDDCLLFLFPEAASRLELTRLVIQLELHFNIDLHCYRCTVLCCRPKSPFRNSLDGFLIQPFSERTPYANVTRHPFRIYYQI